MKAHITDSNLEPKFVAVDPITKNWIGVYSNNKYYMIVEWKQFDACVIFKGNEIIRN